MRIISIATEPISCPFSEQEVTNQFDWAEQQFATKKKNGDK